MAKQLKLRRGTTAEHSTFIGAEGEVTVDTTKDTLVVHDGVQAGGFPVATERDATPRTSTTGSTKVPSGTEAQRDASPQAGYFRFNTESGKFEGYNGTEWGAIAGGGEASFVAFEYIATAGQTTFSGNDANGVYLSYTPNSVQVMLNGVALQPGNDYTATNATSVVLTSGAAAGDEVTIYAFNTFEVADTYTRSQADAEFFRKAGEDGLTLDGPFIQMKSAAGQGTGFEFAANGGVVGTDSLFVGEGSDGTGYVYHRGAKTLRLGTSNTTRLEIASTGKVTVPNVVQSTSGGFQFPDGTTQTTAAVSSTPTTAQVLTATAGASADAVGTYAFLRPILQAVYSAGNTLAGSSLRYSGGLTDSNNNVYMQDGSAPSGTWRCMGHRGSYDTGGGPRNAGATLWLRIS